MHIVLIGNRQYRSNGNTSLVSGRLLSVEYQDDFGVWKTAKNMSRREEVQRAITAVLA